LTESLPWVLLPHGTTQKARRPAGFRVFSYSVMPRLDLGISWHELSGYQKAYN
jgi:hypothetical protein